MNLTDPVWLERRRSWNAFAATEIGRLFVAFENAHARAWQIDGQDVSDKRLREAWDRSTAARREFLRAIGYEEPSGTATP